MINEIDYVDRIERINCINPGVLDCSELQLKDNANDPTNSGMTFWVKKGDFSRLLAFTVICKYFTRSIKEINKIPLGEMTSNSPWGKNFTLLNSGVVIFSSGKGGIAIVICHLVQHMQSILRVSENPNPNPNPIC